MVLEEIIENKKAIPLLEDSIGKAVANYFQDNAVVGGVVKWQINDAGLLGAADCDKILPELHNRRIVVGEHEYEIIWEGWVKLNFDGATRGNPGESDFGCIIGDENGHCLWATYGYLGNSTNNNLEMEVVFRGIKLSISKGLLRVEIEGDSQVCIIAIGKGQAVSWKRKQWVQNIKSRLDHLTDYKLAHIYREGNKAAYVLANRGANCQMDEVNIGGDDLWVGTIARSCQFGGRRWCVTPKERNWIREKIPIYILHGIFPG
ncbi:hypothetical protein SUGI_0023720 [Cryptomeria japonica]|nr:hypothetical protein SUGI_0023720 [Cryptomeria japonica]